eukprot:18299-Heterococcus_DN1.PRE.1
MTTPILPLLSTTETTHTTTVTATRYCMMVLQCISTISTYTLPLPINAAGLSRMGASAISCVCVCAGIEQSGGSTANISIVVDY